MNIFITEAGAWILWELERIITQSKQSWGNREALSNNNLSQSLTLLCVHLNSLLTAEDAPGSMAWLWLSPDLWPLMSPEEKINGYGGVTKWVLTLFWINKLNICVIMETCWHGCWSVCPQPWSTLKYNTTTIGWTSMTFFTNACFSQDQIYAPQSGDNACFQSEIFNN